MQAQVAGVLVFLHWSVPAMGVGAGLFAAHSVKSSSFTAFMATTAAVVALVFIHELGHAVAGKLLGLRVHAIVLHGAGGMCFVEVPQKSYLSQVILLSGGVCAQVVLLTLCLFTWWLLDGQVSLPLLCAMFVFTAVNLVFLLGSIVPYKNNDGAQLVGVLKRVWQERKGAQT